MKEIEKIRNQKVYPSVSSEYEENTSFVETFTIGFANKASTLIVILILIFIVSIPLYIFVTVDTMISTNSRCIEEEISDNAIVVICNSDAKEPTTDAIVKYTKKGFNLKYTIHEGDKYIMHFVHE